MTNDARTPDEIERDSAEERAQLSSTINDFQKKFSVESIVHDFGDMFRGQGSDLTRRISSTVGRNPAAVALMGAGLAWLLIGRGGKDDTPQHRNGPRKHKASPEQWDRNPRQPARPGSNRPAREGDRFWFGDDLAGAQTRFDQWNDEGGNQYETDSPDAPMADAPMPDAAKPNGSMADRLSDAAAPLRDKAVALTDRISDAAAPLRDKAMALTDRLLHGTEGFSDEAKARILAARRAAHDARVAAEAAMLRGRQVAGNLFDDQPLVVGGLALAIGAAIGGALPRTRIEDDQMGASRDQLFADAQAVFRDERAKAMAVLKAAGHEAKAAVQDAGSDLANLLPDGKSPGDVIVDRLSNAATRVLDGAKDEAGRQGLGSREA